MRDGVRRHPNPVSTSAVAFKSNNGNEFRCSANTSDETAQQPAKPTGKLARVSHYGIRYPVL